MPKPRLVPPAMVPPAMPSGVLSHIANDQWVMMTTQWVMMTTRNTILTAKSLSWTKPGTCESGRLRGLIYTSTGKRAGKPSRGDWATCVPSYDACLVLQRLTR